jgi:subtilisin family serine protease
MRRHLFGLGVLCLGLLILSAGSPAAFGQGERVRVWVGFDRYSPQAVALVRAAGGTIHYEFPALNAVAATLPQAALEGLRRNPNVIAIEEDPIREPYSHTGGQTVPYGISLVQADQVGDTDADLRKICIIDSGYFRAHEDLQDGSVTASPNSGTGDPFTDKCGHGTHVAGTIAAIDNAVGVIGVLPHQEINLHIVKVFGDSCSWTYSSSLVAAADQCVANGANIISMSLGGNVKSTFEQAAFNDYYSQGVLSVAAAGNAGNNQKSYPASYPSVVSVAAVDSNKQVASFSQKNSQVELAAPGVGVLSTVPWHDENTLTVGTTTYIGNRLEGAADTAGTSGALADGGLCTSAGTWSGKVVLCSRGDISFCDKATNVKDGGGVAAVIYNNASGNFLGTLGTGCSGASLPVISLSQEDGLAALGSVGQSGTVVSVLTEDASGYEPWDGTSMATPHVSGVAGLVWSHFPQCTNDQIRKALQNTAEDLPPAGKDNASGYGLVRAAAAYNELSLNGCSGSGGGGGGECKAKGESCTIGSECCSGSCGGKPGSRTCK